ncbi:MAG: hypothetical protein DMF19_01865 [Verrucomicrobia bacterium]|nr:MAG: hypothetical protein DMF19_01865 [Verrucomicrobiota bacterium]
MPTIQFSQSCDSASVAAAKRLTTDSTNNEERVTSGALEALTRYIRKFVINYEHFAFISACIIENPENLEGLASRSELVLV